MNPFCGATDTPVLDFWWCLLWVSSFTEVYVLHISWASPLVWHLLTSWWQPSCLFYIPVRPVRHWWDSKPGAIMPLCEIRPDALPTELSRLSYPDSATNIFFDVWILSLISFNCSLILFTFTFAFVRCEWASMFTHRMIDWIAPRHQSREQH